MSDLKSRGFDPLGVGLLLAGAACVVPFLQPTHFLPIRTFYDEWLALAFGLAAVGLAAAKRRRAAVRIPALALLLIVYALFMAGWACSGHAAYAQLPILWLLYSLFAALLVVLGHDFAASLGSERACDVLASCLFSGALANAVVGVLQVFGIPPQIDHLAAHLHGTRAIGNVGQANLYANYLALGEASLLYLYTRGRISLPPAVAAGLLLLTGAALASSRSSSLYAVYFGVLGWAAYRRTASVTTRRLGSGAMLLAIGVILAQAILPALRASGISIEGEIRHDASPDSDPDRDATARMRLGAWGIAWRLFTANPWTGVGPGQFAGAAYAQGLPPDMAAEGVWTSPHNLILQLLSESGLPAAALVCAGLAAWLWRTGNEYLRAPNATLWWITACAGVEITHALLEFPFWYANFLGVTALVIGIGAGSGIAMPAFAFRSLFASATLAGLVILAVTIGDYFRFVLASPIAAGRSIAPDSDIAQDRNVLRQVSGGLLRPSAELWLFLALPLDSDALGEKIAIGERLLQVWPSHQIAPR